MNIVNQFRRDQSYVLDRLVDGELGPDDRRTLLAALDEEPGAWRQCALAFLEAQSWRWQMMRAAVEPLVTSSGVLSVATPRSASKSIPQVAWLAIAAGLAIAFMLGALMPRGDWTKSDAQPRIAQVDAAADVPAIDEGMDEGETVLVALEEDGNRIETFKLPIEGTGEYDANWLAQLAPAFPAEVASEFRQSGLEVNSHFEFYPLTLSDGRQVIVPIEQVEVRGPKPIEYY